MDKSIKREAIEILGICEKYGCGNVMEWASAFHRYRLEEDGLPPEHAFVSVIPVLCDENDEGIKLGEKSRKLYDSMVHRILKGD